MQTMNKKEHKESKGRLAWIVTALDIIVYIAYFIIGIGGISNATERMDFVGIFDSVRVAIIFLILATIVITVLCFIPIFKSKVNIRLAIWNIIWIVLNIYLII